MLFICSRSLRCVSDRAAMSWQWGFLCLGTERPMVVSAADFRVPFSKSHFWLADMFGLTSGSDSDTASRNCARRGPLASCSVL